jgi:hypothetical protein
MSLEAKSTRHEPREIMILFAIEDHGDNDIFRNMDLIMNIKNAPW